MNDTSKRGMGEGRRVNVFLLPEKKKNQLSYGHYACMHAKSLLSCPTLCDPMDSSPPGFSVHRILQARILE